MRRRILQCATLAGLTALETIRQPAGLIVVLSCLGFIAVLPLLISHSLGNADKLVRDSALALQLLCGLLLGAYAACSSLAREIRRGTAAAVLSKPISRGLFFLSKYLGVALVLLFFSVAVLAGTLLAVHTVPNDFFLNWYAAGANIAALAVALLAAGIRNFFTRKPFPSAAFVGLVIVLPVAALIGLSLSSDGHWVKLSEIGVPWAIIPACALVALSILILAALAVSLATRLDTVPTLLICAGVFLVGLVTEHYIGRRAGTSVAASILYTLLPNWQPFWVADALHAGQPIPWRYVAWAALYAGLYLTGVLSLGLLAFRRMEVKA